MTKSSELQPLDPSLHDFDPAMFGSIEDLKNLEPNTDGWSAVMVCCSEFGFQPDQNSIFEIGELYIIQNFGNIILPAPEEEFETEVTRTLSQKGLVDVIVCGHLNCRTVGHFLLEERESEWLQYGNELREFMTAHYKNLDDQAILNVAAQENVLLQLEKEIRSLNAAGINARLHGWIGDGVSQHMHIFDPTSGQF